MELHSISKKLQIYRRNTIIGSVVLISLIHIGVFFSGNSPLLDLLATGSISIIGAISIISIAYHQANKIQEKQLKYFINFQKHSQRQSALARLSAGFATNLRKTEICKEISRRLFEIQGYQYVAVYLIDERDGNRYLIDSVGSLGLPNATQLSPGQGLSEAALIDKELKYTPDVSKNPKYVPGIGQGSEIDVPIQFDQQIMGVIVVENKEIGAFGTDDFSMITIVADQAALALQNTRLLVSETRRRIEAEALSNATKAVRSELELDQVLDRVLTQLSEFVPFDSACIFLWKETYFLAKAASGLPKPNEVIGCRFSANDTLFLKVLAENKPLIIGDIGETTFFKGWGGTIEMRSWMGIPLKADKDVIGILTLDKREKNAYNQEKADFSLIFANQAAIAIQHAQLYQTAKDAADQLMVLHEASQIITRASFNPEQTYKAIHGAACQLMPCEAFSIAIKDNENDEIEAVYLVDRDGRSPSVRIPIGQGLSGHIISSGKPLLIHDYLESKDVEKFEAKHFGNPDHIRAFIAVPMKLGDQVVGMLSAQSYLPYKYSHQDQRMLEMLAAHAAIAIDNTRLFAKVQYLAITDGLTGCHNRRYFFDTAKMEFFRAVRYQHPLSIIMLDLDNYKKINDTWGHLTGDIVLKKISQLLQDSIRETDTLGRYGGDEFSILLPETDLIQALEIAERLRYLVSDSTIEIDHIQLSTTISVGVSSTNDCTTDFSQLFLCADMALYESKRQGRNRVCIREWPIEKET